MKNATTEKIKVWIFGIIFILLSLFMAPQLSSRFSSVINTYTLIFLFTITVVLCAVTVAINKNNLDKIFKIYAAEANIILLAYIADYSIRAIKGQESYYTMLWISCGFVASIGVFTALAFCTNNDKYKYINKFWLAFTPTYAYIFLIVFLREPNTYYELNLTLGNGILSYTDYLIGAFKNDFWMVFNFVGNVVFFIPLVFIIDAFFPKLKQYQVFLLSCIIPYLVEGYQYVFKCGSVDVDDLVLNTGGIIIGMIILLISQKKAGTAN